MYSTADCYSPERILAELEEVTGKKVTYTQVSSNTSKSFLPEFMAEEMLENHLFVENPGYYNGARLKESHGILDEKPVSWKEYIKKAGPFGHLEQHKSTQR